MANVNNNNLFFNSSIAQNQIKGRLNNAGNDSKSSSKAKECFDNFISVKADVLKDNSVINSSVKKAEENVKNSETNKTAKTKAEKRAKAFTKNTNWGNYTVITNAKQNKNSIEFKIKDKNGKTGKAAVKYGSDNSKIITVNINGVTTEKIYDSQGRLRQITTKDKSTGNTTINKYDETGKINTKKVEDTKTGIVKTISYYDDAGEMSRKNTYNEGGQISSTIDYEYNSKGILAGSYTTVKSGSDKAGKVKSICTIYDGNKRTVTTYNEDGTSNVINSTKNVKTGKYETDSKTEYDKKGNLINPQQHPTETDSTGTNNIKEQNTIIDAEIEETISEESKPIPGQDIISSLIDDVIQDNVIYITYNPPEKEEPAVETKLGEPPIKLDEVEYITYYPPEKEEPAVETKLGEPPIMRDNTETDYRIDFKNTGLSQSADSINFDFIPSSPTIINRTLGDNNVLEKITDNNESTPVTLINEDGILFSAGEEDKAKIKPEDIIKKSDSVNFDFRPSSPTTVDRRIDGSKILGDITKIEQQTTPITLTKVDDIEDSSDNID